MDVEPYALTARTRQGYKKSVSKCITFSSLNSSIYCVKFVMVYLSLLMVPECIILFTSDVCYILLFLFSPLKLSGNKSKCHYWCSKNGVGIIILSFKKSTYLLLWRSFAASCQHYCALWPRLIARINLPTRELRLCWQSLRVSFSAELHRQFTDKRFAPLRLFHDASQLASIYTRSSAWHNTRY